MFVLIHMLWGVGLGLYGIFIVLFAHRIFFFDVGPDDVTPLLWMVMGAVAISTNAGSTLILTESGMPFLDSMRPFIDGVTLIMWAWATWWISLLLLFGIWKHGVCRVPLTYTPMFWSLVFPLGMYALGQPPSFACGRLFAVACDILFHGLGCACSLDRDARLISGHRYEASVSGYLLGLGKWFRLISGFRQGTKNAETGLLLLDKMFKPAAVRNATPAGISPVVNHTPQYDQKLSGKCNDHRRLTLSRPTFGPGSIPL